MASCQDKVRKSKEQYEVAVSAITNYNSRYQEVCRIYLLILVILLIYGLYTIWNIKWFVTKLEAKLSSFCKSLTISRSILFYLNYLNLSVLFIIDVYLQDMTDVFERCQRKEAQRLQTFKDTLFQIHKCLNISSDPMYVNRF